MRKSVMKEVFQKMDSGVAAMLTLEHEVNAALEGEVSAFITRGSEFNEENFAANIAALDRVFRTLNSFGLIKGYEPMTRLLSD